MSKLPKPLISLLAKSVLHVGHRIPIPYMQGVSMVMAVMTGQEEVVRRISQKNILHKLPKDMRIALVNEAVYNIKNPNTSHRNKNFRRPNKEEAWRIFDCVSQSNIGSSDMFTHVMNELLGLQQYEKIIQLCAHHSNSLPQDAKPRLFKSMIVQRFELDTYNLMPQWASDQIYDLWKNDLPGNAILTYENSQEEHSLLSSMCYYLSDKVLCEVLRNTRFISPEEGVGLLDRNQLSPDTVALFVSKGWDIHQAIKCRFDMKTDCRVQLMKQLYDYNEAAHEAIQKYHAAAQREVLIDSVESPTVSSQHAPRLKRKM